ncbi:MAG: ESX secretion-associated protein EspG [Acidimicrobiaceae bacterium]|nr:ESX secretion-associated protein EspG [Acidimicrobiaceae bacterium]
MQEEVTVDFSMEELDQLFTACDVRPPPGLEAEELPPAVRDAVRRAVTRSLQARGMLTEADDGAWRPIAAIAQVIAMLARPGVAAKASLDLAGQTQTRRYGMVGTAGVEQQALADGLCRLTLFETNDLLGRVLAFLGRPAGPRPEAPPFRLPVGDLRQALRLASGGDAAAVRYVLRSARVPRGAVVSFSNVLVPEVPVATFEVNYLAPDGVFRGGELTWIDHVEHGLWSFPPLVDGPVTVEVSPTSPDALVEELRSYLPAETAAVAVG